MPGSDPEHAAAARRLETAVRDAGALALTTFRGDLRHWTKDKDSPVSEADLAVDALLKARLCGPGAAWLSEETEDDPARLSARRVWVVDPIDGTRAYIAGLSDWSISAALVEDGRPVVAAVFAPVENTFFLATSGAGATCNGVPIRATDGGSLAGARVAGPKRAVERLAAVEPAIAVAPRVHSLALRITWVAQGRLDIALVGGSSHDWDLAAADLLLHEAGGRLTDFAGDRLVYNRAEPVHTPLIAAGAARHGVVAALLREPHREAR